MATTTRGAMCCGSTAVDSMARRRASAASMTICTFARSMRVVGAWRGRSTTTFGSSSGEVRAGRTMCSAWYEADDWPSVAGMVFGRSGCGPCIPSSKSSTESFRGFTGDDAGTTMPMGGVLCTGIADAIGGCEGGPTPGSVDTCSEAATGAGVGSVGAMPRIAPGVDGSVSCSLVVIPAPGVPLFVLPPIGARHQGADETVVRGASTRRAACV